MKARRIKVKTVYEELYRARYSHVQYVRSGYAKEVRQNWSNHVGPAFGEKLIGGLSAPTIHVWHLRYKATPYAGNRSKSLLSQIFAFAELRGYCPVGSNPCRVVPDHKEQKRKRFASKDELKRLGEVLRADYHRHPREVTFIYFLVFTGSRPSALERLRLDDFTFDPDGAFFTVPGKTGEDTIVVPQEAISLLRRLPKKGPHILGAFPRSYWERARKKAGCEDLWARDLRRTFATIGLSNGVGLGALGELLNHRDLQTSMLYSKLTFESRFNAVRKIGKKVSKLVNVVT